MQEEQGLGSEDSDALVSKRAHFLVLNNCILRPLEKPETSETYKTKTTIILCIVEHPDSIHFGISKHPDLAFQKHGFLTFRHSENQDFTFSNTF